MAWVRIALMMALVLAGCGGSQKADPCAGEPGCDETETSGEEMSADSADSLENRGKLVRSSELAMVRTAGDEEPTLSDALAAELRAAGLSKASAVYKVCIDEQGQTSGVTRLKSSGLEAYDREVERVIATWTHKPFVFDGGPLAVCSPIAMAVAVEPSDEQPADAGPPPAED